MPMPWPRRSEPNAGDEEAVVSGVVYPPGAAGAQTPPSTEWTLRFVLRPWRQLNEGLDERELSISQTMSQEGLREYMRHLEPYNVVRARVKFEAELRATLIELVEPESDEELERRASELQAPITTEIEFFGTLTFDRRVGWWETEQSWADTPVRLSIEADEDGDVASVAKTAEALWRDQSEWDDRLRGKAVEELLALKNENWLGDDEAEVSPDEFKRRMKLEAVTVAPDGETEFWFEDGGLFLGHSIQVSANLADGPRDADIAG
jgi:hypothetical protein